MQNNNKLGLLDFIVILLTLYVLGALLIDSFWQLPKETTILLNYFDYIICTFFFIEFLFRFWIAENKLIFMKWGWIDLLSSIPMVDFFRAGRILRLIRIFRVVRAFKSTKQLFNHFFKNKAEGALTSVVSISVLLVIFSAIAILEVESLVPNSNIKTAEDAFWWSYSTLLNSSYGDVYPVTMEGRIISMILMFFGLGLLGTITAYIASIFVKDKTK
jgi:voltage-gated potassium channel